MRIELNAGGLGGLAAISGFHTDFSGLISRSKKMISAFQVVRQQSYGINGGVGNLQGAVNEIESRISIEENRITAIETVEKKANSFLELTIKTDIQASTQVNRSKNEFYRVNPWAKPPAPPEEKKWYQKAGEWLYNKGKDIVDGAKKVISWAGDTLKKAWGNLVEFYNEHKKIIDTILIVVGAVAAIAAVICTGGVALVPMLTAGMTALGVSAATATTIATVISLGVAVVAVGSTIGSSTLNIIDIWGEVNDPTFQKWKTALNITSAVSNGFYSIGNLYNSVKGVSGKEFIARQKAIQNGKQGYGQLSSEHPRVKVENGREFSSTQKEAIYRENARRNGGVIRDDVTGKPLTRYKCTSGSHKPLNGAEIDHITPKSLGGQNSFGNARVINWETNLAKSNNPLFPISQTVGGVPDVGSFRNGFLTVTSQAANNYTTLKAGR